MRIFTQKGGFIASLFVLIIFLYFAKATNAETLPFERSRWIIFENDGVVNFEEGKKLKLSAKEPVNTFPLASLDLTSILSNDYTLQFILSFNKVTDFGSSLRIGNYMPQNNQEFNDFEFFLAQDNNLSRVHFFQVWQDLTNRYFIRFCPEEFNRKTCVLNPKSNNNLNSDNDLYGKTTLDKIKFTIEKKNSIVKVYIQNLTSHAPNELLFEAASNRVPSLLLLGHNVRAGTQKNWTELTLESEDVIPIKPKIILIPGFFGSWNRDAILHNQDVDIFDWKLNPIVHEYDGLINTFKNIGLEENKDFFVFPYDWRKKIESSSEDLNSFIKNKIPDSEDKINLVGHSLGGLVGRLYVQKFNPANWENLITVGSPHQGLAVAYKPVEGGDLEQSNTLDWLSQKSVIAVNGALLETDRTILNRLLPVLKDLFPTYDFLRAKNGPIIPANKMIVKNDTISFYNSLIEDIFNGFYTFAGTKGNTLYGFEVVPQSLTDKLLDIYPDGRPTSNLLSDGDDFIPFISAASGKLSSNLPDSNHGEIIYKKDNIKKILQTLKLDFKDEQIAPGAPTIVSPSIIFFMKSPAIMEVEYQGVVYPEKDGIILIENAKGGDYILRARGQSAGKYTVVIGEIGQDKDSWNQITGNITATDPTTQTDTYQINFDVKDPPQFFVSQDTVAHIYTALTKQLDQISPQKNRFLDNAKYHLSLAQKYFDKNNPIPMKTNILLAHQDVFDARRTLPPLTNQQLMEVVDKIENLYDRSLTSLSSRIPLTPAQAAKNKITYKASIDKYRKDAVSLENKLLDQKKLGKDITVKALILKKVLEKLDSADKNLTSNNFNLTEILLKSINSYLIEVKK